MRWQSQKLLEFKVPIFCLATACVSLRSERRYSLWLLLSCTCIIIGYSEYNCQVKWWVLILWCLKTSLHTRTLTLALSPALYGRGWAVKRCGGGALDFSTFTNAPTKAARTSPILTKLSPAILGPLNLSKRWRTWWCGWAQSWPQGHDREWRCDGESHKVKVT